MFRFIKRCWNAAKNRSKWIISRMFPIDKKKITISSFYGRGYGDNAKYIVEKLLKSEKNFKIIWIVKNDSEAKTLPEGVTACKDGTFKCIYHLMTSKIWIDNCRKYFIMLKRRNQFYIQTWHGFALNRIEKDAIASLAADYEKLAMRDSKNIDYIISCSKFMTDIYRNSFWYDGEIIETGAPRNDILIKGDQEIKSKVYEYFNIQSNKKIILYAPTFRADRQTDAYSIDYKRIIDACNKRFDGEFIFITRLHPNIAAMSGNLVWSNEIINGSYYSDMQELMVASNIIITDYSSVMFDFALQYKPCFQFATDISAYKNDRNFYFELDKLPFSVAENNDELEKNILDFSASDYKQALETFYNDVGMIRAGNAADKCCDIIIEKCYGKEN